MKRIILLLLLVPTIIDPIICYNKKMRMYYSSYHNSNINKYTYNYLACKIDTLIMLNHNRVSSWLIIDTIYDTLLNDHTKESRLLFIDLEELASMN